MLFQVWYKPTGTNSGNFEKLVFLYTNGGELRKITRVNTHQFSNTELAYERKGYKRLFPCYVTNKEYNETKRVWKTRSHHGSHDVTYAKGD